ncbi:conserved Plasmodium protein, unknown function [Plasmodium relictum]|uniref:Uncharacterized protein n=1 Tax=Plasmodium relictum TaxID=85471 RepID=A0A1J1HGV2_PLARL|nr:conserved Plasmodium protein, unknown function [Plasmodium relictum]CRH03713.1 conserved Plasmodium protein, unknown function [Plasmodium relictum]
MMNFSNNVNIPFENDKEKKIKRSIIHDEINEVTRNEKKYVFNENNNSINRGINDFCNENVNDENFNHSFISKDFIKNIGICYNIINDNTIFEKDSSFTKISNIIEFRIKQIIEEANKFFEKRKKYCVNKFLNIDDFTNSCHYLNVTIPYKYKNNFYYKFITLNETFKNNKVIYRLISKKNFKNKLKKKKKHIYLLKKKKKKRKNSNEELKKFKNKKEDNNKTNFKQLYDYKKEKKIKEGLNKDKKKKIKSEKNKIKNIKKKFIKKELYEKHFQKSVECFIKEKDENDIEEKKKKIVNIKNEEENEEEKRKKKKREKEKEKIKRKMKKDKLKNDDSENQKERDDENKIKEEINIISEKDKMKKRENNNISRKKDEREINEIYNEEKEENIEGKYRENGNYYDKKEELNIYKDISNDDYIKCFGIKTELEENKELKYKESNEIENEEKLIISNNFNNDNDRNVCDIKEEYKDKDNNNNNDQVKLFEEKKITENCDIIKYSENNDIYSEEIVNKTKTSNNEINLNENDKIDEKKKEENKKKKNSKILTIKKKKTLDMKISKENNLLYNSYINNNENKKKSILNFILSDMQNSLPAEPNLTIFWLFIQNNYKKKKKDKNTGRKACYFNYQCYEILYAIEKKNEHKKKKKDDILNHHYFKYNNIFLLPKFYPINKEYTILSKYILEIIKDIINYRINFFDYNNILHIFSTSKEINKILTNILFFIFNELDHNLRFNNIYASLMLLILLSGIIKNSNIDIDFYCLQILKMLIHVIIYEHELKLKNIYSILLLKRKACDIINDFCCILRKKNNNEIINIDSYLIYISSKLLTHEKCTYMHIYISYYLIYLMPINIHIKFFLSFTPNFLSIFFRKYLYYQNNYNSFLSYEQKEMNELFNFFFFHIYTLIQGSLYRIFKNISILIINSSLSNYLNYLLNFIIDYADYHLPLILSILKVLCKNTSANKNINFFSEKKHFFDIITIKNYAYNKHNLKKKKNYLKNVQEINNFYINEENSDQGDNYLEDYLNDEDLSQNGNHSINDKKQYFNEYIKKRALLNKTLLKKNLEKNQLKTNITVNNVLNKILNKFENNTKSSYLSNKYDLEDFLYESSYYFLYTF